MPDYSSLSEELIFKKAEIFLDNRKKVVGIGDESSPDYIADSDWLS